jgi:uncharacterized Zn-binding protein involved in type VI secretion
MPAVARQGDFATPHIPDYPPRPNIEGSPDVYVNGQPLHRVGDNWAFHSGRFGPHGGVTLTGSATVFCNGRPVARVGDPVSPPCLSTIAQGSPNVFCNT